MSRNLAMPNSVHYFDITNDDLNLRLDLYLTKKFHPSYSRSFFQNLINNGYVFINNIINEKSSYIVKLNDKIAVNFPSDPEFTETKDISNIGAEILYEHQDFLIIYKPAGLLVHPADSNQNQITLVDWLISKFNEIKQVGISQRPGIVHRLDMNTSGILIIPRNNYSHMIFSDMFKNRKIKKTYLAVVQGHTNKSGSIDYSISRHPNGNKMTHTNYISHLARESITDYETLEYFDDYSLVQAKPITGRTHQIRVHFAAIGHALVGDTIYGKKSNLINRQALHAYSLEFEYENKKFSFCKEPPLDFTELLKQLKSKSHFHLTT